MVFQVSSSPSSTWHKYPALCHSQCVHIAVTSAVKDGKSEPPISAHHHGKIVYYCVQKAHTINSGPCSVYTLVEHAERRGICPWRVSSTNWKHRIKRDNLGWTRNRFSRRFRFHSASSGLPKARFLHRHFSVLKDTMFETRLWPAYAVLILCNININVLPVQLNKH